MTNRRVERIGPQNRLRTSTDYATVKRDARALRGRHCMVLAAEAPGLPTRVGFIASRKGVGGAVQRNRARRRLREIVRRRWPLLASHGHSLAFIAYRTCVTAPHLELVADVERLLIVAGAFPGRSLGVNLLAKSVMGLIWVYQQVWAPHTAGVCRYVPSCSKYASEAVSRYGALRGAWLAVRRISRCHPLGSSGYDPVP